jgi:acetyltransferase-like isoleucine patch superfamily enzyme
MRVLRAATAWWRWIRFRLWVTELRLRLRTCGARLELDAPHGAALEARPVVKAYPMGTGSGVFRLSIGPDVRIGSSLVIELFAAGDNSLAIGAGSVIQNGVRMILRGGSIEIGERTSVRDGAWLKSDGLLKLGSHVQISQYDALHCHERLVLGDWVGLAERVTVLDSDHGFDGSDVHFRDQDLQVEPTEIGANTFAAAGAVILRGTRLGRNSFVAANAVVRGGEYEPGALLAGIPAKVVDQRSTAVPVGVGASAGADGYLEHEGPAAE